MPDQHVIVYSKKNCVQCRATIKRLDSNGTPYTYIDQDDAPNAFEKAYSYGISQMPIVVAGEQVWGGYSPDRLDALA